MRAIAIIPARLASLRLPRKMLLAESGLPLVVHTARNLARAETFARVVVAADDEEILAAVRRHGLECVLTRVEHVSGTDRVHEAAQQLADPAGVIVNVQGDEPELEPADLERLVRAFDDASVELATLAAPLAEAAAFHSPSVVKLVCDARGDALYFSRAPIPATGHDASADPTRAELGALRHVGVYAFRPAALARFCALPRSPLEQRENLEQLRWLEAGGRLRAILIARAPHGIDTRLDYDAFVARVRDAHHAQPRHESPERERARAS